jgi:membrane protein DedA with SNARE-associated domain
MYWIRRYGCRLLLMHLLKTLLSPSCSTPEASARFEWYFQEHGRKTVFFGHFGPRLESMTR